MLAIRGMVRAILAALLVAGCGGPAFHPAASSPPTRPPASTRAPGGTPGVPGAASAAAGTPVPGPAARTSLPSAPPPPFPLSAPPGVASLEGDPAPPALVLTAIAFANARTGWLVGDRTAGDVSLPPQVRCGYPVGVGACAVGGEILATSDGGRTWHVVWAQAAPLYRMAFTGPSRGWAWGPEGLVRTTDGGRNWTAVALPGPGALRWVGLGGRTGVWLLLADGAWANATHPAAALYHGTNDGPTWTLSARTAAYPVQRGAVASALGQPCLPPAVAPETLGSPAGWRALLAGSPWGRSLGVSEAFSGSSGWALTGNSATGGTTVSTTADGGVHWRRVTHLNGLLMGLRPAPGALWALTEPGPYPTAAARCPATHWECATGLAVSRDGGRAWQMFAAPADTELTALAPLGAGAAFALAVQGHTGFAVLHTADDGRTWQTLYVAPHAFGPTWRVGMWNAHQGWGFATAVDPDAVLRTADGGAAWTVVGQAPRHTDGYQVSFSGPRHGWLQTGNGRTFVTADGGTTWNETAGAAPVLYASWQFLAPGHGYALVGAGAGSRPNLNLTRDGGTQWTTLSLPATFRALAMTDPRVGWALAVPRGPRGGGSGTAAVRPSGAVLEQTVDGGRRWRAVVRLGTRRQWLLGGALAAPGPDALWLLDSLDPFSQAPSGPSLGGPAVLLRSRDGARTWTALRLPANLAFPQAFTAVNASMAWEITGEGNLWATTDGGALWHPVAAGA